MEIGLGQTEQASEGYNTMSGNTLVFKIVFCIEMNGNALKGY